MPLDEAVLSAAYKLRSALRAARTPVGRRLVLSYLAARVTDKHVKVRAKDIEMELDRVGLGQLILALEELVRLYGPRDAQEFLVRGLSDIRDKIGSSL